MGFSVYCSGDWDSERNSPSNQGGKNVSGTALNHFAVSSLVAFIGNVHVANVFHSASPLNPGIVIYIGWNTSVTQQREDKKGGKDGGRDSRERRGGKDGGTKTQQTEEEEGRMKGERVSITTH